MAPLKSIRNVFVGALAGLSLLLLLLTAREVVKDVAALDVTAATPWIPPANGGWVHASEAPRRATGEPRQDYSCSIIHWQLSALPPLFCSTGGYDFCPESAQCSGEEFGVPRNFSVHFHESSSEPRAVAERYLAEADVVVFAYPIIEAHESADDPTPVRHQTSTLVAMESGGYRPYLRQPSTFARFDYTFGFRTDLGPAIFTHDFSYIRNDPALTFGATPAPFGSGPKMSASDERTALAVSLVTSSAARFDLLSKLSKYVPSHHCAGPVANRPGIEGHFDSAGPRNKIREFAKYMFCYAIENSQELFYVTEKFFDALQAGCIPIYFGAPNVRDVWREPNSFVHLREFPTLRAAGEHILEISRNETLWASYHAWRKRPPPLWMKRLFFNGLGMTSLCRMCHAHWTVIDAPPAPREALIAKGLRRLNTTVIIEPGTIFSQTSQESPIPEV